MFCVVLISLDTGRFNLYIYFYRIQLELLVFVTDIVPYASPQQKTNLKLDPESN